MRILVSFIGKFQEYLGSDLKWLGVIEAPDVESSLKFRMLDLKQELNTETPLQPVLNPVFGGTGLARSGDFIFSALQWHTPSFAVLDLNLHLIGMPICLVEDVHSIAFCGSRLFAAETLRDRVVSFAIPDYESRETVFSFDTEYNEHHLNSVAVNSHDEILMAFHRDPIALTSSASAVVINLSRNEIIDLPEQIRRLHSLIGLENGEIAFCDSMAGRFWTGRCFINTRGYARGLALYGDHIIAGSSRIPGGISYLPGQCAVQIFDRETGQCINEIVIAERWEIYDILVLD